MFAVVNCCVTKSHVSSVHRIISVCFARTLVDDQGPLILAGLLSPLQVSWTLLTSTAPPEPVTLTGPGMSFLWPEYKSKRGTGVPEGLG